MSARCRSALAFPRATLSILNVALAATALLFLTGCAGADRTQPTHEPSSAPGPAGAPPAARPLGQHNDASLSAQAVVQALARNGFLVPNPLDVTAQICPSIGCDQSIVTDTLRATSFPSPDAAKHYAREHGLRRAENVVVTFTPVMPATEQDKYWSAIVRIFP